MSTEALPRLGQAPPPTVTGLEVTPTGSHRLFYRVILPLLILTNLLLGILVLSLLAPIDWHGWLYLGTGAFCCGISGWLLAVAWSRVVWGRTMGNQIARWRRIADVFLVWLEETPVPVDAVSRLQRSLQEAGQD